MALSKEFIEKQTKALLEEKEHLTEQIDKLSERPDYGFDEEDNIRELTDFESNISLESQLKVLLEKVNSALKAIENGTYGQCIRCQQAVEEKRLEIMPYAEICVSCAKKSK